MYEEAVELAKRREAAKEFNCEPVYLKVAGKPDVISKNF